MTLEGNYTFADNTANTGDLLSFGGAITSGVAGTQTLTVSGVGNTTINGVIGGTTGTIALLKSGNGQLTLNGNNTFTGGVTINAGNLVIGNVGALNSTTPNGVTFVSASTGTLSLNGKSIAIGQLNGLGATASIIQDANATSAALTVNFQDTGTVFEFDGTLQDGAGGGKLSLVKSGTGVLSLAGNNTFTGGVTINAGNLVIGSVGALNSTTPNAVVFGAGGSFPELDLGVSVTVSGLATPGGTTVPFVRGEGTSTTTLTVNNSVTNNFAGRLFDDTSPLALVKGGVGTLILSDSNNFSGGVTIKAGTLQLNSPAALFGPTLNVVTFGAGSTGTLDLNGFSSTIGGLNTNSLVGTPVVTNSSSTPGTLEVQVASGNSTYAGVLQDGPTSGSLLLLKTGSGTLTLSGTNTFTAPVNINGGTLAISGGSLAADVRNQATFNYYGGTFAGRLFNSGTANFFSDFTAENGMENDSNLSIGPGESITLAGAGLDNEGTLSMTGVALNLSTTGANVNRGNINLSTVLSLAEGAALTNSGSIALNGGVVTDASGTLTNTFGGAVSGFGTIQCVFANSGGLVGVGGGTLNITQPFNNSGIVQLTAFTANLGGGAINNTVRSRASETWATLSPIPARSSRSAALCS